MVIVAIILKESKGLNKEELRELYDGKNSTISFSLKAKSKVDKDTLEMDMRDTNDMTYEVEMMDSNTKLRETH